MSRSSSPSAAGTDHGPAGTEEPAHHPDGSRHHPRRDRTPRREQPTTRRADRDGQRREHDGREGLEDGDDAEHFGGEMAHGAVVAEHRGEEWRGPATAITTPATMPSSIMRTLAARVGSVARAEEAPHHGLGRERGDGE